MKIRALMNRTSSNLWPPQYQIDKVVELPRFEFNAFMIQPQDRYEFIKENRVAASQHDNIAHCLLVLEEGQPDGALVLGNSAGEAGLVSYVAGARDVVQAKLNQVVDFIVRQGTEHTASGSWCIYSEDLTEKFDLTISDGSGLDTMLKVTLERRPEVAAVEMASGAIETTFHPEFCAELRDSAVVAKPDIRLRDILPLLTGSALDNDIEDSCKLFFTHPETDARVWPEDLRELTPTGQEDYTALLNARVTEIIPTDEGIKMTLTDVEPEELVRFNDDYDAFQRAEQAMGDMTP